MICFFFSSRRRHTRYWRDWISDVCSSDLDRQQLLFEDEPIYGFGAAWSPDGKAIAFTDYSFLVTRGRSETAIALTDPTGRSEERRVGKECRSRWSPYH